MKAIKPLLYILPILIFVFCLPFGSRAQIEIDTTGMGPPEQEPTLEDLKDSLSNSGNWVQITEDEMDPEVVEGEESNEIDEDVYTDYIWIPNPVLIYVGWNPYINGRWVWTCWGWQWISYENWGWCTHHYGRWWWHHSHGWVWSPGHRWRHNWVTWYHSRGFWGWLPLPPRIHHRGGIAVIPRTIRTNNDDGWVFVDKKDFTRKVDKTTIVDAGKHNEIFSNPNETVQEKGKKTQTLGPNVNVPNKKKPDTKISVPESKIEKKTSDYGTPKDPGNKKEEKPVEKKEQKSNPTKSNDSWYSPPKTEYKDSPPPKTETKVSPPPKTETKQDPPPKTEIKFSPPPKEEQKQSPPPKKDNSSGN